MGELEEIINTIMDKAGEQKAIELIDKNNLGGYYDSFNAVMAGDLQEEQVCTPDFINEFRAGLEKILAELN